MNAEEKAAEEAKRDRCASPLWKWQALQAAITFAEENTPREFRRNVPRWPKWLPQPTDEPAAPRQP